MLSFFLYYTCTEPTEDAHSQASSSSSSSSSSSTIGTESPNGAGSFSSIPGSSSTDTNGESFSKWVSLLLQSYITYKLIGDNLDKHVTPSDMRLDRQAQSLHYFNCYAVKDRLSTVDLEDQPSLPDLSSFSEAKILPTAANHEALLNNIVVLVSGVIKKNFTYFSKFGTGVPKHIKHKYYAELSKKSEVVSLIYIHVLPCDFVNFT